MNLGPEKTVVNVNELKLSPPGERWDVAEVWSAAFGPYQGGPQQHQPRLGPEQHGVVVSGGGGLSFSELMYALCIKHSTCLRASCHRVAGRQHRYTPTQLACWWPSWTWIYSELYIRFGGAFA